MSSRTAITIGVLLVIAGLAFAALPKSWIEDTLGFEPDGGNGMLELIIAVGPIVIGVALVTMAVLRRSRSGDATTAAPTTTTTTTTATPPTG